ncbi:MAG: hypothetical protein ACE366_27620 [Bradymonadia bacterium]
MSSMIKILTLALALAASVAGAAHAAPAYLTDGDHRAELVLRSMDTPLTADVIAKAGITEQLAIKLLQAPEARPYDRVRAVSALAFFPTDTAFSAVAEQIRLGATESIKIQAVITLARAFGPQRSDAVKSILSALPTTGKLGEHVARERARLLDRETPTAR